MGRTEKSQGLAPPAVRKVVRAKQARQIINTQVVKILASNARAKRGAEGSILIADPGPVIFGASEKETEDGETYVKRKGQGRRKVRDTEPMLGNQDHGKRNTKKRNDSLDDHIPDLTSAAAVSDSPKRELKIRIIATDTLTAAHMLALPSQYGEPDIKPTKKSPNVCVLNHASPLRPGGGVFSGATSQEEFLCSRTTLYPSLKESFYRLPEIGGIYTHDVLVFRNSLGLGCKEGELGHHHSYWIDVVSAGMLRFPELEGEEDEVKRFSKKDMELVEAKMRGVLRIATSKGAKRLVLGAWGCGAYGNPVADIARSWKKVINGGKPTGKRSRITKDIESWPDLEAVNFAIPNRKMATEFASAFDNSLEVEVGPHEADEDEEEEEQDAVASELRDKIQEIESQLSSVWNPALKHRLSAMLDGLKTQLGERVGEVEVDDTDEEQQEGGVPVAGDSDDGI
ncbi:hypothetical protein P153DRAFT_369188 [Dothidotthia symphoricarpi CBS 119687]|uniref:Microbial-type PARG catalytic domain-containing protein n=1 Tax=Dothidotthia symphoricarpi CBS 119687 TaxID=1392245 RepID=A0A6A6A6D6_9PLEO|nr:uncharacterized protein P153DRAFT_369188 [Dothidotthia symphoricarpi CBS 119687]KAF2126477.1 hypothetical protein P153DRAFT_369188 [Dothidotthia symphoricarpi CBS 119687]